MDLSLDEIIKKKNVKTKFGSQFSSKGKQKTQMKSRNPNANISRISQNKRNKSVAPRKSFQSSSNTRHLRLNTGVVDARVKIIKNSRQRLYDARDKLSQLAKQSDARTRIQGANLNVYKEKRQDRVQRTRPNISRSTSTPMLLQRSIRNSVSSMRAADPSSLIRCTINRSNPSRYEDYDMMDVDSPPPTRQNNNFRVTTRNEYVQYGQDYMPRTSEPFYSEPHYEHQQPVFRQFHTQREQAGERAAVRMSQQMRARLDTPSKSSFMYAPTPLSPPPLQGHRIVVSNLHPSVTHEDIKELFEDIGPLVASRLVRPGTAEVIYKMQKDAKTAVDAYHNRQLDGQPMKCLLVNSRPSNGPSGVLRSSNMHASLKFPVSSKSMVIPELSTIHKALFTPK